LIERDEMSWFQGVSFLVAQGYWYRFQMQPPMVICETIAACEVIPLGQGIVVYGCLKVLYLGKYIRFPCQSAENGKAEVWIVGVFLYASI